MTKKTILITKIQRKEGFLYFCGTDSTGNLTIGEVEMSRGKRKKKK